MKELGLVNHKKVFYIDYALGTNWAKSLHDKNWLLAVIISNKDRATLNEISREAINCNLCYACCIGDQSELLHDMIDDELVFRDVDVEDHHLPPYFVMTTWDKTIEEGLRSALLAANHPDVTIESIVCLNASGKNIQPILTQLLTSK
jgi:hypothetical protein